jgi:sensor domain CHASE-containing protein
VSFAFGITVLAALIGATIIVIVLVALWMRKKNQEHGRRH